MLRLSYKLSIPFVLLVSAFALLIFNAASYERLAQTLRGAQIYLASESESSTQRGQSDVGGQSSFSGPEDPFGRSVREALKRQYEQKYGETAEAIRRNLGMKGPTADFVGYDSQSGRWLIAEFKTGTNIGHAWDQLLNTTNAFIKMNPGVSFELRLYVDAERFQIFQSGGRVYNWALKDGVLGYYNEAEQFVVVIAEGVKVLVQVGL